MPDAIPKTATSEEIVEHVQHLMEVRRDLCKERAALQQRVNEINALLERFDMSPNGEIAMALGRLDQAQHAAAWDVAQVVTVQSKGGKPMECRLFGLDDAGIYVMACRTLGDIVTFDRTTGLSAGPDRYPIQYQILNLEEVLSAATKD